MFCKRLPLIPALLVLLLAACGGPAGVETPPVIPADPPAAAETDPAPPSVPPPPETPPPSAVSESDWPLYLSRGEADAKLLTEAFYRYYAARARHYEIYAMPVFSPAAPPDWDALTRYIWLELSMEQDGSPIGGVIPAAEFRRLTNSLMPAFVYTDHSSKPFAFKDGLYSSTGGWDFNGMSYYRLTALTEEDGVFTAFADVIYFEESPDFLDPSGNLQVLVRAYPEIVERDDSLYSSYSVNQALYERALTDLVTGADPALVPVIWSRLVLRFQLSGAEDYPLAYLAKYGASVASWPGSSMPSPEVTPETAELTPPRWARVRGVDSVLNTRTGPGTNFAISGRLNRDDMALVHARRDGWAYVGFSRYPQLAWVSADYLEEAE
ncbi:MAG: SH3 domain-containing protein [Gracilibacteraceae bacterium]|nr:SH3 domain-containing protein [Gracilibacteraceae bacterium]